jgi:hypothetical protein
MKTDADVLTAAFLAAVCVLVSVAMTVTALRVTLRGQFPI